MSTSTLPNTPKLEAISLLCVALEALEQDQLVLPIAWVDFLRAIEWFCWLRGWEISYNKASDLSCAIFAHEQIRETEGGEACQTQ